MIWESFESTTQILLADLLADTSQRDLFKQTNKIHERMVLDLTVRVLQPDLFLEIGAYEASTSQYIARRLPTCDCFAFEADPSVHAHFSDQFGIDLPNFSYQHAAVTDASGTVTLAKQTSDDLLKNNSIRKKPSDIEYQSVTVPAISIDDFTRERADKAVFLRIDVEGLAYEVIQGALATLPNTVAIYSEVEDYEIWQGQRTVFEIYPILEEFGFVPISRDVETPGQYNVFWIRKPLHLQRSIRARASVFNSELLNLVAQSRSHRLSKRES